MAKLAKRFGVFLMLFALLATSLLGCKNQTGTPQETEPEEETGSNLYRYSVYIADEKLMVADLKESTVRELDVGISLGSNVRLGAAICGDRSPAMVLGITETFPDPEHPSTATISNTRMYYWNGASDKAELICEAGELVRVGKNMDAVLYMVEREHRELYLYTPGKGNTLLSEQVFAASLSEDGSHVFYQEYAPDKTTPPFVDEDPDTLDYPYSVYHMQLCERTADGKTNVLAVISTHDLNINSMGVVDRANVAPDHSAAGYRKDETVGEGRNRQAYLWTKETGEQKLPFEALSLYVMGADDIYYVTEKIENENSVCSLWHYDGEKSVELLQKSAVHVHKIADDVVLARTRSAEDEEVKFYIFRDGKAAEVPLRYCSRDGYSGFTEYNKTFSGWNEDTLYTVSLEEDSFGQVLRELEGVPSSPRTTTVTDGSVRYTKDDQEWLDGHKLISGDESDCQSAAAGDFVSYQKDGKTYLYSDGKTALLAEAEEYTMLYANFKLDDTQLSVYAAEDGLYYSNGSKVTKLSGIAPDNADSFLMVTTWDQCDTVGSVYPGVINGAWFSIYGGDYLAYWF